MQFVCTDAAVAKRTSRKALVANGSGGATVEEVEDLPVRSTYVKIKVHAAALNSTDYKHVLTYAKGGEIVGTDVTGEVVAIGSEVKTQVQYTTVAHGEAVIEGTLGLRSVIG